ncbi:MAG: hypothetical protein ACI4PG_06475 [Candidatus Ventricola sp.]
MRDEYAHYGFFHRTMNYMRSMGYSVEKDPEVLKRFRSIAYCHWYGRKGDLEFHAEFYPAGFKIEFFQNVHFVNGNGGRYDFDKWDKMPYSIRLEMINTMRHIREFFGGFQLKDVSEPVYDDAESKVKKRFVESCHHPQKSMDFDLHDLDGTKGCKYSDQNNLDRDGKEILNGQIKYTRDDHGYLVRGRVYYDLNMNWLIIFNQSELSFRPCWDLFDLNDSDVRGRDHSNKNPPKEYRQKIELLHGMKTSWLENELRRRRRDDDENA